VKKIEAFFFDCRQTRWISFLRLFLGLGLLYEGAVFYYYAAELFSAKGLIQAEIQDYSHGYSVFGALDWLFHFKSWPEPEQRLFAKICLGVYLFFAGLMTAGILTRVTTIVAGVLYIALINSSIYSIYGVDQFLILFVVYLMLTEAFSTVDWFKSFMFRMCQLTLALSYLNAGVAKSLGNHWWIGESVWRVVNQPNYQQVDLSWLGHYPWIFYVAGWATLFFEIGYPFMVSSRRCRVPCIAAIVGMHLGIGFFMGLWFFAYVLIVLNVGLFLIKEKNAG